MHIDSNKLDGEYPPEPECQVNSNECSFTPIHALCHECGRKVCEDCAIGVRHQPQLMKYVHSSGSGDDRFQLHCPDCARNHDLNTTILGAGGGCVVIGLLLLFVGTSVPLLLLPGLIALGGGGYLLYNERRLKTNVRASEIGP